MGSYTKGRELEIFPYSKIGEKGCLRTGGKGSEEDPWDPEA